VRQILVTLDNISSAGLKALFLKARDIHKISVIEFLGFCDRVFGFLIREVLHS